MNFESPMSELAVNEEPIQFQFVVDADLVHVGGGTGLLDY